jgi:hypothetical protein
VLQFVEIISLQNKRIPLNPDIFFRDALEEQQMQLPFGEIPLLMLLPKTQAFSEQGRIRYLTACWWRAGGH